MTNYERIQIDKEFCASVIAPEYHSLDATMEWLDTEQREVTEQEDA